MIMQGSKSRAAVGGLAAVVRSGCSGEESGEDLFGSRGWVDRGDHPDRGRPVVDDDRRIRSIVASVQVLVLIIGWSEILGWSEVAKWPGVVRWPGVFG